MKKNNRWLSATGILIIICIIEYVIDKYVIPTEYNIFSFAVGGEVVNGTTIVGKILGLCGGAAFIELAFFAEGFFSGEYWRIVTFLFVHLFSIHLLVNMLALWITGQRVEKMIGVAKFLLFFFVVGIVDLVLTDIIPIWGEDLPVSGGASGAIFGLMGYLASYSLQHKGFAKATFTRGQRIYLAFYGIFFSYIVGDNWTAIAHTVGFALGFLIGYIVKLFTKKSVEEPQQESNEDGIQNEVNEL